MGGEILKPHFTLLQRSLQFVLCEFVIKTRKIEIIYVKAIRDIREKCPNDLNNAIFKTRDNSNCIYIQCNIKRHAIHLGENMNGMRKMKKKLHSV